MCELCITSNLQNKQAIVMIMPFCDVQITTKQASVMNSCHSVMYKQASVMIIPNKQTSNRDELRLCFHSWRSCHELLQSAFGCFCSGRYCLLGELIVDGFDVIQVLVCGWCFASQQILTIHHDVRLLFLNRIFPLHDLEVVRTMNEPIHDSVHQSNKWLNN